MRGDQGLGLGWSSPAFRLPSRRRDADREDAEHHGDEINRAHGKESLLYAQVVIRFKSCHEIGGQRRANKRPSAKAHDGHASRHTRTVWEPLNQGGNRRDVANAKTNAANHSIAQIDQPELVNMDANGRDEKSATEANSRGKHGLARTCSLQPLAKHSSGKPKKNNRDAKDPAQVSEFPVQGIWAVHSGKSF